MSNEAKRQKIVDKGLSRKGKNQYTQGSKRTQVGAGYGDCSSTARWCYQQVLGIDIGINTEAQIKSSKLKDVEVPIKNGIPDESYLRKADLFYFRGDNTARTKGVGHVEMYIGNGQLLGHGSGFGPTIKNMKTYCTNRQNQKGKNGNKGLICVRRALEDDKPSSAPVSTPTPAPTPTPSAPSVSFKEGDEIILTTKTYANGKLIPAWVLKKPLYYRGMNKSGIMFSILKVGAVTGTVKPDGVVKKSTATAQPKPSTPTPVQPPQPQPTKPATEDYSNLLAGYKGTSIVDAFRSKKLDSSFANRKKYAEKVGIKNYKGTASQNVQLLKLLGANK